MEGVGAAARAYCTGQAPRVPWDWATSAMYVSGSSCSDSNSGKTAARTHLFRRMLAAMQLSAPLAAVMSRDAEERSWMLEDVDRPLHALALAVPSGGTTPPGVLVVSLTYLLLKFMLPSRPIFRPSEIGVS